MPIKPRGDMYIDRRYIPILAHRFCEHIDCCSGQQDTKGILKGYKIERNDGPTQKPWGSGIVPFKNIFIDIIQQYIRICKEIFKVAPV